MFYNRQKIYLFGVVILLILGCEEKVVCPKKPFEVTVYTSEGQPIDGAFIEGGFDWEFFRVQTDSEGIAILPGHALGERAVIYKNNYFPQVVRSLSPTQYILTPTPQQFELIGNVAGTAIRFDSGTLLTIEYGGGYHMYSYNDQEITEVAFAQLPITVKKINLYGDTLWFSTHEDGIYVYTLQNPLQPQQLFHLDISGYLGPFAVKDTILGVGYPYGPGPLRIFSYTTDGQYKELSVIEKYFVKEMTFISNYLILIGNNESLPTVFDLNDPLNPVLVYNGLEWEYKSAFLFGDHLILVPKYGYAIGRVDYKLLNLSDPANPASTGGFSADSWLIEVVDDSSAAGHYYFHSQSISVLSGSISDSFYTIAIISESALGGFGGGAPPYFIIGNQLWKLEDR
ncbi:hypothetical protein CH333_08835 [candidate division WOR-3 bacterium JGI_Cruoil_03_44_89]|uniref:Uncharacterized protein n=1 Tax=candidate division WOR-3 bacterium JGI_Cruoil_03_44_89 TaxID=1973748 RepID=A0A235BPK5_UNCW3|nr:MAG: hypothetical protein CH333_08835 [candidate division WOR-3 bacterium JGI_Cruoil_03_44_89]